MCRARSRKAPCGHGCPLVVAASSRWTAGLALGHGEGEGVRVTARPAILTFPGTALFLLRWRRAKPSLLTPLSNREAGLSTGWGMLWEAPQIVEGLDTAMPCRAALLGRDAGACSLCHSLQLVLGRRWMGRVRSCIGSRDSSGCLAQVFGCVSFPSCPNSCKLAATGHSTCACQVKG